MIRDRWAWVNWSATVSAHKKVLPFWEQSALLLQFYQPSSNGHLTSPVIPNEVIVETLFESDIRADYLVWSGGFPPESTRDIFVYVEAARPIGSDPDAVALLLKRWLDESERQ